MKALIPALAAIAIGAVSSISYAPPAQAAQFCQGFLRNCPAGQQDACEAKYEACVDAGGNPVTSSAAAIMKPREH